MPEDSLAKDRSFPSTRWSLIARAQDLDPELRRAALDELLRCYFPALRGYLVLCKGLDPERAEDLLQGFVAEKILERDFFGQVDQRKGRFRQLLRRSLHHYLIDQIRHEQARGRWAGQDVDAEPDDVAVPDKESPDVFDVAWARQVIAESVRRMYIDYRQQDRLHVWGVFEQRILLPTLSYIAPPGYDQLVERFGFDSPHQASNALMTAKRQFKRTVEAVVAEYVESQSEIDDEIRDLQQVLASPGALQLQIPSDCWPSMTELPEEACVCLDRTSPSVLGKMLNVEEGKEKIWHAEELGDLLRHQLSQPLRAVLPGTHIPTPPIPIEPYSPESPPLETLGDLLRHPKPPLELLEATKRLARDSVKANRVALPAEVSTVLYLASVAAALVRDQQRITKSSDDVLRYALHLTLDWSWLDDVTRDLLQQALAHVEALVTPEGSHSP